MTIAQATAIYFKGKHEAAKKRIQKLKAGGLVAERARRPNESAVLFLSRKGIALLRDEGALAQYPSLSLAALEKRAQVSALTIRHELAVMDVKSCFHAATVSPGRPSIAEFTTWPRLIEFDAIGSDGRQILVRPDGFIRIQEKATDDDGTAEHTFFLEVDRSSESIDTLVSKATAYLGYYKSGGFAERCGGSHSDFKEYPFRVLMVFKTGERRNNMAEALLRNSPPILTQAYLTTMDDVMRAPFGEVWIRPIDYRDATNGTRFAIERSFHGTGYRRDARRDEFIAERIKRTRLLE